MRHGAAATFAGLIRRDPRNKDVIVVTNMSCNSSRTTGLRPEIIDNLKAQDPDLLLYTGDQTYRHTEHTAGWIGFGLQFRDIIRDRPTITIPDDHDVGHPNLWGESGKRSTLSGNADGGYFYPVDYVNLVQRAQTWHLPDPVDPEPVQRGISVYFTRLRVGGIDFAILEERKFKSGPAGKILYMGPRPEDRRLSRWAGQQDFDACLRKFTEHQRRAPAGRRVRPRAVRQEVEDRQLRVLAALRRCRCQRQGPVCRLAHHHSRCRQRWS